MDVFTLLIAGVLLVGLVLLVRLFVGIVRLFAGVTTTPRSASPAAEMGPEDESYAHSGPYGYSPNTAYPQTQYGSLFDPDAEWAERTGYADEHHDDGEH